MRVKIKVPTRRELELTIESFKRRNDDLSNMYAAKDLELKKTREELHRQRHESLTRLIDSVATLNRSLATVVGEANVIVSR